MKFNFKPARIFAILAVAFFLSVFSSIAPLSLGGAGESVALAGGAEVTVLPKKVEYKRRVPVFISGSGFKPNQEVGIRITMGGVLSDVSYLVKPRPKTNANGSFGSVWTLNREIRRKLVKMGKNAITIVDANGNELASGNINFVKARSKKKKKKK